jgi:hypothetical protein
VNDLTTPNLEHMAVQINEAHRQAGGAAQAAQVFATFAGLLLLRVKGLLPHGQLRPWVAENCEFSVRTSQVYMARARKWLKDMAKAQSVALLSPEAGLKLLAPPAGAGVPGLPQPQVVEYVIVEQKKSPPVPIRVVITEAEGPPSLKAPPEPSAEEARRQALAEAVDQIDQVLRRHAYLAELRPIFDAVNVVRARAKGK